MTQVSEKKNEAARSLHRANATGSLTAQIEMPEQPGFEGVVMAKVFTIPVKPEMPDPTRRKGKQRSSDPRYIEGQRVLVEAMKYLVQQDPQENKDAVMLLSEHFRTRFRMSDRPGSQAPVLPVEP